MRRKTLMISLILLLIPLLSACHYTRNSHSSKTIQTTINKQNYTSLRVDGIDSDIELRPAKQAHIVYKGPKNSKPAVSLNNGTLTINQNKVNKGISFRWFPFGFSISRGGSSTIIIYLPQKQLASLKIANDDGDINGYGTIKAQQVHLKSDDGDIAFDKLKAQTGSINSSDGDISLTHLITQTGFKISADDGNIDVDHTNASGYKVSSDDGDLTVNGQDYDDDFHSNLNSKNVLTVNTDDGDIDLN